MKMKRILAILLSAVLLLSLFTCGKTEAPETTNDDTQNDEQKEENKQPTEDNKQPDEKEEEPIPTDPVSKEVYDLKHNEDLVHAPFSFYSYNGTTNWETDELEGSVSIFGSTPRLQIAFVIPKEGESTIDATVGYNKDDPDPVSDYRFSFKLYLKEQGVEGAEYKAIHTNLVPWSIYLDPTLTIYRCTFYDSGLLDIVEVGKTYDTVVAIYEDDKVVGWGESELTWYEDSQNWVEKAEQNESVIK